MADYSSSDYSDEDRPTLSVIGDTKDDTRDDTKDTTKDTSNPKYKYYTFEDTNGKVYDSLNASTRAVSRSDMYAWDMEVPENPLRYKDWHIKCVTTKTDHWVCQLQRFLIQHYPVRTRYSKAGVVLLADGWHRFRMYNSVVCISVAWRKFDAYGSPIFEYGVYYDDRDEFEMLYNMMLKAFAPPPEDTSTYRTYYTATDGYWQRSQPKKKRSANTLFLADNKLEAILGDLREFNTVATRRDYESFGVPHIYSAIIYGPPGTGKSSLIDVLASELNRTKAVLNIKGMKTEALKSALDNAPENSIVVLEDVDAIYSGRETLVPKTVSFGDFINILDGSLSTSGLIFILTTNHIEKLEPALFRAARIKRKLELSYIGETEIKMMWDLHYEKMHEGKFSDFYAQLNDAFKKSSVGNLHITPAELLMFLFSNRKNDYATFIANIPELIGDIEFRYDMEKGITYGPQKGKAESD